MSRLMNMPDPNVPALPADLWVMRAAVISTGHVEHVTMDQLSGCKPGTENHFGLNVIPYPEGALVGVPCSLIRDCEDARGGEAELSALVSDDLAACLRWAGWHGFGWVRFDCDGDEIDGLPRYEW